MNGAERGIFVNRTLNMQSIKAIGYDMDYTLIHYRVADLEERAYEFTRQRLAAMGWPVSDLAFDPGLVSRGLVVDLELGNIVKATRFGYVIKGVHGTRELPYDELRTAYQGVVVDLSEPRWHFMNTLYSLSEGSLFAQLIERLDEGRLPGVMGYDDMFIKIRDALDETHIEGTLKAEIYTTPDRFVVPEPEIPAALLDQRRAGKHLMLITNSDWEFAQRMMALSFDPYLPTGETWRDLFGTVIVSAMKPLFFAHDHQFYRVVDEDNALLQPHRGNLESGSVYFGGNATMLEESLKLSGDEVLYVGDHLFGDVHASKSFFRWRTALVLRELENEIRAAVTFREAQVELDRRMTEKSELEHRRAHLRLAQLNGGGSDVSEELDRIQSELSELDGHIAPLAQRAATLGNPNWGPLMRAGNDKSLFARQLERYADIYMSRVSNFLAATPYALLRAPRGSLPHDV